MCGFAGVVSSNPRTLGASSVQAAFTALGRRGPDAHQLWADELCTLLHTRLRVIDVSERADQPLHTTHGRRVTMVFNGEIYNYRELRVALEARGVAFTTSSDAEVLLLGYCEWDIDVFKRARGMWSVALWDAGERQLTLCRDPFGKKPLLFASSAGRISFASTVPALLAVLGETPPLDEDVVDCYLGHLCVPQEHSIFKGVEKVPPGCVVRMRAGGSPQTIRYWTPPDADPEVVNQGEVVEETERLLRQAVRRRLVSDVPLGVFLSAGIDSGLVAAFAAMESGRSIAAVTAGTDGSEADERGVAALVAARYGMAHHPLEVAPLSAEHLPALIGELGEPFGDSSLLPSYAVARAARREMTVALTGDGGDEGFFGYSLFTGAWLAERYRRFVPAFLRHGLYSITRGESNGGWRQRVAAVFEYGRAPLAQSFRNRMGFASRDRRLLRNGSGGHVAEHIYHTRLVLGTTGSDAAALQRTLLETYLPNDYLTKVDLATMFASLEARCPFLDQDLLEFLLRLPPRVMFPSGRRKLVLRKIASRYLPEGVVSRPKTGFSVPVREWLQGPLTPALDEFVLKPGTLMSELVRPDVTRRFIGEQARGADHSTRLWGLLALGVWCAVIVEHRSAPSDPLVGIGTNAA